MTDFSRFVLRMGVSQRQLQAQRPVPFPFATMVLFLSNQFDANDLFGVGGEQGLKLCGSRREGQGGAEATIEAAGSEA